MPRRSLFPASRRIGASLLLLALAACGGGGEVVGPVGPADPLPRLAPGTHLGVIFVAEDGPAKPALEEAFARSIAAGIDSHELSLPWDELEPEPGVYDLDSMTQWLDILRQLRLVPSHRRRSLQIPPGRPVRAIENAALSSRPESRESRCGPPGIHKQTASYLR